MNTEPQDAIPAPAEPTFAAKMARIELRNFHTSGKIVGVHMNDDCTEVWGRGFGQEHHPVKGTHANYDGHEYLTFHGDRFEFIVKVPKAARRYARKFAAEFNTHAMRL